jgi:retron-type reverse transcriptase
MMKKMNTIAVKAANNPEATFDDLIRIISDKGVLYQAMGNISGKSGALTPGTRLDPRTVNASSSKLIDEIALDSKSNTYRFKPIRRVYMDKSGKNFLGDTQLNKLIELQKKGKVTGFTQILKQLNRKQIPCCKKCHQRIHRGEMA